LRTLLGFALLALICGSTGCQASPRHVAERFADALEHPADADFDRVLASDAELYLPGPNRITRPDFRDYLVSTQGGHSHYRRVGRIYDTPGGAGWMLEILRDQAAPVSSADQAPLWMEITLRDGKVGRAWMHFTAETLASLRQPPARYAERAAASNLPLPPAWADGTPAMLAAAEARDRATDSPPWPAASSLAVASMGLAVATVLVSRRRRTGFVDPRGTRLREISSRRQLARKKTMLT